jgi:hypothetical protein
LSRQSPQPLFQPPPYCPSRVQALSERMSAQVTPLVLRQSAGWSSQTGRGLPLRVEWGGQAPHAHCAPGLAGLCHAEPLRMVHWPLRGSQGAPSAAQAKSVVGEQVVLRKAPGGQVHSDGARHGLHAPPAMKP